MNAYMREKRNRKGHYPSEFYAPPIGTPLGIHDCTGIELCVGDLVEYSYSNSVCSQARCRGRILEHNAKKALLFHDYSMWYPPYDKFNPESYGKESMIPLDDGARMCIKRIE